VKVSHQIVRLIEPIYDEESVTFGFRLQSALNR